MLSKKVESQNSELGTLDRRLSFHLETFGHTNYLQRRQILKKHLEVALLGHGSIIAVTSPLWD